MEIIECNCCGNKIKREQELLKEDVLFVSKEWGYFSRKDMERHQFVVCEDCYDKWVSGFRIPPKVEERSEAL